MINNNQTFIRENRYSLWQKAYIERKLAFIPIIEFHLKRAFRKKLSKLLLFICIIITLFFIITIIFDEIKGSDIVQSGSAAAIIEFLKNADFMAFNSTLFYHYINSLTFLWFLLILISMSDITAMDRKLNAVILYLTKPLNISDYLAGKFLSIVIFIFAVGFAPIVLMYLIKIIISQDISLIVNHFFPFLRIFIFFVVYSFFMSSFVIFVSSLMKSSRMVIVVIFIIYFVSGIISGIAHGIIRFAGIFSPEYASLLSVSGLESALLRGLVKGEDLLVGMAAMVIMLVISMFSMIIVQYIIKRSA